MYACGTPVIAYRQGSVPEVVTHGVNGWVVDSVDEAVEVASSTTIDRRKCRETFETRFSAATMASNYVELFERTIEAPADGSVPSLDPEAEAAAVSARTEHTDLTPPDV